MTDPLPRTKRSRGFTLIEILVVLGIIALLIGLLLPAVQKVRNRDPARRAQNNLHQIGVAALRYESEMGTLPPGSLGAPPGNQEYDPSLPHYDPAFFNYQHIGMLALLLPSLEQDNLYSGMDISMDFTAQPGPWWTNAQNWAAAHNKVNMFLCPSALPGNGAQNGIFLCNVLYYVAPGMASMTQYYAGPDPTMGLTNYSGVAGAMGNVGDPGPSPNWDTFAGVFYTQSRTTIASIGDGSSNTLMFGESLGGSPTPPPDYANSWMGIGFMPVVFGLAPPISSANFSSNHNNQVSFCYADGSVHSVSTSVDLTVLIYAGGTNDGMVYDASALAP